MITYDPKTWFSTIFKLHKSDAFRKLMPSMLGLCLITFAFVYVDFTYLKLSLKNATFFHQVIGFVLSMLLVFRINTAYDRWWEGRKQWGALVNNSRNLALKFQAIIPESHTKQKAELMQLVTNYSFALKDHLRNIATTDNIIFFDNFTKEDYEHTQHKPNFIAGQLFNTVNELFTEGIIKPEHLLVLNEELKSLTDITGACERIRNTPIPYSYSLYLKRIIILYVITMPFPFAIDFGYWAVAIVALIFYTFASLELLSEEIEEPFGMDDNDLPTDEIAGKIRENINEIAGRGLSKSA